MTMDAMNAYLETRGFEVSRKYNPELACYEFIITKDGFNLRRNFAYPKTGNPVERDKIQKYFLEAITEEFEREFKKENNMKENSIVWDVKCINIERDSPISFPTITAELKGLINPCGNFNLDPTKIAVELHNRLGRPLTAEQQYIINDYTMTKQLMNSVYGAGAFRTGKPTLKIKKVIFNNPATIVYWMDDTKTVVKCQNDEPFDPEKGLAMAITKRVLGDKGNYFDTIKKYTKDVPRDTTLCEQLKRRLDKLIQDYVLLNDKCAEKNDCISYAGECLAEVLENKKATKAELLAAITKAAAILGRGMNE